MNQDILYCNRVGHYKPVTFVCMKQDCQLSSPCCNLCLLEVHMNHSNYDFIEYDNAIHQGQQLKHHYSQLIQFQKALVFKCTKLLQEISSLIEKYNIYQEINSLTQMDLIVKEIRKSNIQEKIQQIQKCFTKQNEMIIESFQNIIECLTQNISNNTTGLQQQIDDKQKSKIKIYEIKEVPQVKNISYQFISKFGGHEKVISCLTISKNNQLMASGGQDKKIILWRLENLSIINIYNGSSSPSDLKFTPNNEILLATNSEKILLFKLSNGVLIPFTTLKGYLSKNLKCLAITNDSKCIISGGDDEMINVWNIQNQSIEQNKSLEGNISFITLSNNQNYLASYSWKSGLLYLFSFSKFYKLNLLSQKQFRTLVNCIEFTPDSASILITYDDSVIVLEIDQSNQTFLPRKLFIQEYSFYTKLSNDGSILCCYSQNEIHIYDLSNSKLIQRLETDKGCEKRMALSDDMKYLVANSGKNIYQFKKI